MWANGVPLLLLVMVVVTSGAPASSGCEDQCHQNPSRISGQEESCERGCRLFALIQGATPEKDSHRMMAMRKQQKEESDKQLLDNCKHSCEDSFQSEGEKKQAKVSSCQLGCQFQQAESQIHQLNEQPDSMPGFLSISLPDFKMDMPNFLDRLLDMNTKPDDDEDDDEVEDGDMSSHMPRHMHSMLEKMRQQIRPVMQWMQSQMPSFGDLVNWSGPLAPAKGKLIVIESGPGFHRQQTFNINPELELVPDQTEKDMMVKANPLDESHNPDLVEMIDPSLRKSVKDLDAKVSQQKKELPTFNNDLEVRVLGPFHDLAGLSLFAEEPRLPEEGLKSSLSEWDNLVVQDPPICYEDPNAKSWSQWMWCVNAKMSPRWWTLICISLTGVLIMWLCLVVPRKRSSPRSQSAIVPPFSPTNAAAAAAGIKMKEAEAMSTHITVISGPHLTCDLPPTYDQVTKSPDEAPPSFDEQQPPTKDQAAAAAAADEPHDHQLHAKV